MPDSNFWVVLLIWGALTLLMAWLTDPSKLVSSFRLCPITVRRTARNSTIMLIGGALLVGGGIVSRIFMV